MTPSRSQATRKPPRKSTNRRRFWLFAVALLVALAAGAAMFTAVFAGPKPMAQAPDTPTPPPTQPTRPAEPPPATGDQPRRADDSSTNSTSEDDADEGTETQTEESPPRQAPTTTTPPPSGDGGGGTASPASDDVSYKNCGQARKAGVAPLHTDDPGYSAELDKDGDGVACETGND